jgi:hypothetical protein
MSRYYEHPDIKSREKLISELEMSTIETLLKKGKDIIIDNTNLKKEYISTYVKKFKTHRLIQFQVFNTNLEDCIARDSQRKSPVGAEIIKQQHMRFEELKRSTSFESIEPQIVHPIEQDIFLPHCYVFDIDGTLADNLQRNPYDWDQVDTDVVHEDIKQTLISHCDLHRTRLNMRRKNKEVVR